MMWSNFMFFWNAYLWFLVGYTVASICVLSSAIASLIYHYFRESEQISMMVDMILATSTLAVTIFSAKDHLSLFGWITSLCILVIALKVKELPTIEYEGRHLAWHILVSMGQCILALSVHSPHI